MTRRATSWAGLFLVGAIALACGGTNEAGSGGRVGGPGGIGGAGGAGQPPSSLTHLYFLNNIGGVPGGGVLSTTLEGNELRNFGADESVGADGIAVDVDGDHVYWTNMGAPAANDGFILRANLDGTDIATIVAPGDTYTPKQMRLDPVNRKLYWSDREGMRVMRANLDGSDIETLVTIASGAEARADRANHAVGIALDLQARKFYWSQKGPDNGGVGAIKRANFDFVEGEDSTNRTDIEILFEGLPEPIDLDLDPTEGMLYWTDRGDETVNRAPMELSAGATAATRTDREVLIDEVGEAIGLVLDLGHGKMYYTALYQGVSSADLDGSRPTTIVQGAWVLTGITLGPGPL
jgi:DNA-binding beta-propeller fold protein YncE